MSKVYKVTIVLPLMILLSVSSLLSAGFEIKGKVVGVEGTRVKIEYQSEYAPREGDEVQIGEELSGMFVPVEGTWKVVEVTRDFAWAEAEGGGAGTPAPDYLALIQSDDPVKRSEIVPPAEKYYQTAMNYRKGIGVEKNLTEASKWFKKAAELGHAEAQYWLGIYYLGSSGGDVQAVIWFRKAAEQGLPDAQWELAGFYSSGRGGLPKDKAEAFKWYYKAAEGGHYVAQRHIGYMYVMGNFLGTGVGSNLAEAEKWYRKAETNWPWKDRRPLDDFAEQLKYAVILKYITKREAERKTIELYCESARNGSKYAQEELRKKGLSW